jgi:Ca2+:H+ antiporter
MISTKQLYINCILLLLSLGIVVLLAKLLSKDVEHIVVSVGAPKSLVGIIIAGIVLLPEGWLHSELQKVIRSKLH